MTPRSRHNVMLGVSLISLGLIQWGALDLGRNLPRWGDTARMYAAGLLSLAAFAYLLGGLLTYDEMRRRALPLSWRTAPIAMGLSVTLAVIYPLLSGRFGMASVGIMALGVFALAVDSRRRMLLAESAARLDASLENVRSVVRGLDARLDSEPVESAIDTSGFRTPRPFIVPKQPPTT